MRVAWLGTVPYGEAWALQKRLAELRGRDEIPDTLLLLEHPHVYTLGSSAKPEHVLWSAEERAARAVELYPVDRGGDATYHGPGQLVGYPILKLLRTMNGLHADVIGYVRSLEQMLIQALATFGIGAFPYPGLTGVWVGEMPDHAAKIAAIGVKMTTRAVTMHGFALNVAPDMAYFGGIIPCGIADKPVTSMEALIGYPPSMETVIESIKGAFGAMFSVDVAVIPPETL